MTLYNRILKKKLWVPFFLNIVIEDELRKQLNTFYYISGSIAQTGPGAHQSSYSNVPVAISLIGKAAGALS
jgi:hypothetical protein